MRILVHEFASGGGFAGRPTRASLVREGRAMRDALVADLAALGHRVVATVDARFPMRRKPPSVELVTLARGARLDTLLAEADAAWLVAPESGGCLERLSAQVEARGTPLIGSSAAGVRHAADKGGLARHLARQRVPHPPTLVASLSDSAAAAQELGFPLVIKPVRGAGGAGVRLARNPAEWPAALAAARAHDGEGIVLQRYIPGRAASVSLLCDGRSAVALAVNAQHIALGRAAFYRGGETPVEHPLAARAAAVALSACRALPGLRGYVGVDVVLAEDEAVVIEVNPRLTTSYLGVRAALDTNVAALALQACAGRLPSVPRSSRRVRFTAAGRIDPA
jgi:predicted ATP-grasp superfamily ATP-dependent carboligase